MTFTTIDSPLGELTLVADIDSTALRALYMVDHRHAPGRETFGDRVEPSVGVFAAAAAQLAAYFEGSSRRFDLPTDPIGTDFQRAVWGQLALIPYGETRTYGEIAAALSNPKAVRAVGLANGRNPLSIIVPCHRVIGANGAMTGFGGGVERKVHLLELEGRAAGRLVPRGAAVVQPVLFA